MISDEMRGIMQLLEQDGPQGLETVVVPMGQPDDDANVVLGVKLDGVVNMGLYEGSITRRQVIEIIRHQSDEWWNEMLSVELIDIER